MPVETVSALAVTTAVVSTPASASFASCVTCWPVLRVTGIVTVWKPCSLNVTVASPGGSAMKV